jgi:hypothetical protein
MKEPKHIICATITKQNKNERYEFSILRSKKHGGVCLIQTLRVFLYTI